MLCCCLHNNGDLVSGITFIMLWVLLTQTTFFFCVRETIPSLNFSTFCINNIFFQTEYTAFSVLVYMEMSNLLSINQSWRGYRTISLNVSLVKKKKAMKNVHPHAHSLILPRFYMSEGLDYCSRVPCFQ